MKRVIATERIPIKLWLDDIEKRALDQAKHLANLPFAVHHIAVMPDSHEGYGMPIGGVLATENVIIPNAVGVDIGCGMCAVRTSLAEIDSGSLKKIMTRIRAAIPVGFEHQKQRQDEALMPQLEGKYEIVKREYEAALRQIGTLGGGNHFIEIQQGNDGHVWIMIHSGSRNFGLKNAEHYNRTAIDLNERWHASVPQQWQLAYLPVDSDEGQMYVREMQYCVEFALANRRLMMDRITEAVSRVFGYCVSYDPLINIAHNYARLEKHFGKDVWVHRKGATLATENTIGIVPGSQGSKSYIVRGKGNPDSFQSCSHGAGRRMGRNEARRLLNLNEERRKLEAQGILHAVHSVKDLDEAAGAYKDIAAVMANQRDLVEILVELSPLAVIKG